MNNVVPHVKMYKKRLENIDSNNSKFYKSECGLVE